MINKALPKPHLLLWRGVWRVLWRTGYGAVIPTDRVPKFLRQAPLAHAAHLFCARQNAGRSTAYRKD